MANPSKWKTFRLAVMSRKIDLMKKTKYYFGWPKKIPVFIDEATRIIDGKKTKSK